MLDSHLEPYDYMETYCSGCEKLNYQLERTEEDFYYIIDVVQGNLPYDENQWKDSLKLLYELFGYDHPLTPPIFVRQKNVFELKLNEEILQQEMCF